MKHQTNEKDDEQVMREPEDLKVGPSDDLHGGGDDENEGEGDHDPRQSCYCREHYYSRILDNTKHNDNKMHYCQKETKAVD